jgi:hypothetical protein
MVHTHLTRVRHALRGAVEVRAATGTLMAAAASSVGPSPPLRASSHRTHTDLPWKSAAAMRIPVTPVHSANATVANARLASVTSLARCDQPAIATNRQ